MMSHLRHLSVATALMTALLVVTGCPSPALPTVGRNLPEQYVVRASQYAITTDFPMAENDPLINDLLGLRQTLQRMLDLPPSRTTIRVAIFETPQQYEEFLKLNFPELPNRRAFFIKQADDQLAVFVCQNARMQQDLRHEVTHATLHSSLGGVPIWVDEGLAMYFEVGPGGDGIDPRHLLRLRQQFDADHLPNLQMLERKKDLWEVSADDYRECWLWVHFALNHSPETRSALRDYLRRWPKDPSASLAASLTRQLPNCRELAFVHMSQLADRIGDVKLAELEPYPYHDAGWTAPIKEQAEGLSRRLRHGVERLGAAVPSKTVR